jgi:hypothetical protein
MSEHEKTLKIVTNLDRPAIEARLAGVREAAQAAGLAELAALLGGFEGSPREQIAKCVGDGQKWLAGKSDHGGLRAQLDLVELNLKNLT